MTAYTSAAPFEFEDEVGRVDLYRSDNGNVVAIHPGGYVSAHGPRVATIHAAFIEAERPTPVEPEPVKTATAIATVSVRLDLAGLADDLQAVADVVRARLEDGLHA